MKKLGAAIALLILLAGAYLLGIANAGTTISIPEAQWTEGSVAAQSWREFTASLEAAGARVFATSTDEAERLEGLQYLTQLASVSLEMKLAKGDPANPQFTDWMADYRKFLGDSPDAIYHTAELSPEFEYEISGHRGEAEYLGFMLYGRQLNGWNRAAESLSHETIRFDEAGNFSIILSSKAPADRNSNWLKLENDIHMVMVRQYYHGREDKTVASLTIRNLDNPQHKPMGKQEMKLRLQSATEFFNDTLHGAIALADIFSAAPNSIDPPNTYSANFGGVFYPTNDNEYYGGWFYIEDDEALVIEGAVPTASYWAVSLQNHWMQSLDYKNHQVGLNDHQITTENGRYRIVVSHQKPATGNWIDTVGKREGLLSIRYQLATTFEKPKLTLVKFADL